MKVKAVWEFEVDTENFDRKHVDIKGLAKDLTQRELRNLLQNQEISAEDFIYKIEQEKLLKTKEALQHLRKAWIKCNYAFDNLNGEFDIIGSKQNEDEYPFDMSFDEIPVINWIDGCLERLEVELNEN